MHFQFPWTEAPNDAPRSHFLSRLFKTKAEPSPLAALRRARMRTFLSYYRPHVPMLLADLGCAVLVAASAVALPLCASYITGQDGCR